MKIILLALGLFCLTAVTNAGTFLQAKQNRINEHILTPEKLVTNLKSSDFGKNILNLMSLSFKTSGKLDDVNSLIGDLQNKLRQQQDNEDNQYKSTSGANTEIINNQNNIISTSTANIKTYTDQLQTAQSSLAQLTANQGLLQQELDGLNAKIPVETQRREDAAAAFAKTVEDQQKLILGIQKTENVIQQATANGRFNADSITKINGLLEDLKSAFAASIAQQQQQEDQAIQDFQDFLTASQNRIADLNSKLQAISLELTRLNGVILQLEDAISSANTAQNNAQVLLAKTQQAQTTLDGRYGQNRSTRTNQLNLLAQIVVTLNSSSDNVKNYLNQS